MVTIVKDYYHAPYFEKVKRVCNPRLVLLFILHLLRMYFSGTSQTKRAAVVKLGKLMIGDD